MKDKIKILLKNQIKIGNKKFTAYPWSVCVGSTPKKKVTIKSDTYNIYKCIMISKY